MHGHNGLGCAFYFLFKHSHSPCGGGVAVNGNERPTNRAPIKLEKKIYGISHVAARCIHDAIRFHLFSPFFRFCVVILIDQNAMKGRKFRISFQTHVDSSENFPMVDNKFIFIPNIFMWRSAGADACCIFRCALCMWTESQKREVAFWVFLTKMCCCRKTHARNWNWVHHINLLTVQGSTSNAKPPNRMI